MTKDFEEEHFQIYNIIDRLREECREQYGSLYKASKFFGQSLNKYLSNSACHLGFGLLIRLCRFLNISIQYATFGGVKENFVEQKITLNNFYKTYKEVNAGNVDHNVYVLWWNFKNGKRNAVSLKYIINTAKKSRKTVDFLLGG